MLKVGMRVRRVSNINSAGQVCNAHKLPIGAEGIIVKHGFGMWEWVVDYPQYPGIATEEVSATEYFADSCMLAPLTDPNAEWATEQVRKLFKIPVAA